MRIPKIIHQIWLGLEPPHPLMMRWRRKWLKLHPEWQLWVWREHRGDLVCNQTCHKITPCSYSLLSEACNLAQRANIWRYHVLSFVGGLYADLDVEPVLPVDPFVENLEAFTAQRSTLPFMRENALMGATPHHPWMIDLLGNLQNRDPAVSLSMGCDYLTEITKKHPEVSLLPKDKFLFVPPDDWSRAKREALLPDEASNPPGAAAVHHWASLWHKRGFVPIERHDPPRPTPPDPSPRLAELAEIAKRAGSPGRLRVLEWGSGLSTSVLAKEAATRNEGLVVTIDHEGDYQRDVLAKVEAGHLVHPVCLALDGPLTVDTHSLAREPNYATFPLELDGPWDLIVVDGRRRLECCLVAKRLADYSISLLQCDPLIVLHDYRRRRYDLVLHLLYVEHDGPEYRVMRKR
jgi:hypothetical protein